MLLVSNPGKAWNPKALCAIGFAPNLLPPKPRASAWPEKLSARFCRRKFPAGAVAARLNLPRRGGIFLDNLPA